MSRDGLQQPVPDSSSPGAGSAASSPSVAARLGGSRRAASASQPGDRAVRTRALDGCSRRISSFSARSAQRASSSLDAQGLGQLGLAKVPDPQGIGIVALQGGELARHGLARRPRPRLRRASTADSPPSRRTARCGWRAPGDPAELAALHRGRGSRRGPGRARPWPRRRPAPHGVSSSPPPPPARWRPRWRGRRLLHEPADRASAPSRREEARPDPAPFGSSAAEHAQAGGEQHLEGAQHGALAGVVAVEEQHHVLGATPQVAHVVLGQRRPAGGDGSRSTPARARAMLIEVALDDDHRAVACGGSPRGRSGSP